MTDTQAKEDKATRLSRIAQNYGLADLYVFGSRAQEIAAAVKKRRIAKCTPSSDIDIGVRPLPEVKLSSRDIANISIELEDLFDVKRVDLVSLPTCDPFLALNIIRGELLYTVDPVDQAYYELFVLRRAGDLYPHKKARMKMILQGQTV